MTKIEILKQIERKILWFAIWMIHHANNIRTNEDEIKVGGHQASSTSLVSILTALYFSELKPEDRVAIKPHASPAFHAVQYLVNNISEEQLKILGGLMACNHTLPAQKMLTTWTSLLDRWDWAWHSLRWRP